MKKQLTGITFLAVAVLIWGSTFVAQSVGMDSVGPFTFQAVRCALAVLFLLPVIALFEIRDIKNYFRKWLDKKLWLAGILCGLALFIAASLQQVSLVDTDAGKAGFLTALYVILVPLFSIFVGKLPRFNLMIAVGVATVGVYLLCLSDGIGSVYLGDLFLLCCAVAFTLHILTVNRFVSDVDGILLSALQFLTCGILSAILSLIFEDATWSHALAAAPQILFLGIASSGIAYTLQIIGQKFAEPTVASITMSLESVFAALGGWLIAGNALSGRELFGCALVFVAIVLAQIPFSWKNLLPNKKRRS